MKSFAFAGLALVAAVSFTACDPKVKHPQEPVRGPVERKIDGPTSPTIHPEDSGSRTTETTTTETRTGNVIPEPPKRSNPEYGIKIDGKTGYVKSPYDGQGRPIDVRGLPPGTEVEDPYTPGRTLLVP